MKPLAAVVLDEPVGSPPAGAWIETHWASEHHKPRYILDLLLSVINVSIQTVDIVNNLPRLKFE